MKHLKPCQNCGSTDLHHYTASREIECNSCSECRSESDWQAPRPIEDALRAEVAALRELVEALEWRAQCFDSNLGEWLDNSATRPGSALVEFGAIRIMAAATVGAARAKVAGVQK